MGGGKGRHAEAGGTNAGQQSINRFPVETRGGALEAANRRNACKIQVDGWRVVVGARGQGRKPTLGGNRTPRRLLLARTHDYCEDDAFEATAVGEVRISVVAEAADVAGAADTGSC